MPPRYSWRKHWSSDWNECLQYILPAVTSSRKNYCKPNLLHLLPPTLVCSPFFNLPECFSYVLFGDYNLLCPSSRMAENELQKQRLQAIVVSQFSLSLLWQIFNLIGTLGACVLSKETQLESDRPDQSDVWSVYTQVYRSIQLLLTIVLNCAPAWCIWYKCALICLTLFQFCCWFCLWSHRFMVIFFPLGKWTNFFVKNLNCKLSPRKLQWSLK